MCDSKVSDVTGYIVRTKGERTDRIYRKNFWLRLGGRGSLSPIFSRMNNLKGYALFIFYIYI